MTESTDDVNVAAAVAPVPVAGVGPMLSSKIVTVGADVYPDPPSSTLIDCTSPFVPRIAVASAPAPPPPEIVTNGEVYGVSPACVTVMAPTEVASTAAADAPLPAPLIATEGSDV